MKTILHKANSRGHANYGWLDTYHTFSFAGYDDPERVHFGALRVLNDDHVSGGMGFKTHPHDNMEIISIVLSGALEHEDSMGNKAVIKPGEVQIMSAGTGIRHAEKNHSATEAVKFLQIWVYPDKMDIEPTYDQKEFNAKERYNAFQTVVSPIDEPGFGVKINQNAWFSLIDLENASAEYQWHHLDNGLYVFVLEGSLQVADIALERRDGLGITKTDKATFQTEHAAKVLLMEVPMDF